MTTANRFRTINCTTSSLSPSSHIEYQFRIQTLWTSAFIHNPSPQIKYLRSTVRHQQIMNPKIVRKLCQRLPDLWLWTQRVYQVCIHITLQACYLWEQRLRIPVPVQSSVRTPFWVVTCNSTGVLTHNDHSSKIAYPNTSPRSVVVGSNTNDQHDIFNAADGLHFAHLSESTQPWDVILR